MKIKDFIKELEKCNPDAEILTEDFVGFYTITGVIDFNGDKDNYIIEQESLPTHDFRFSSLKC